MALRYIGNGSFIVGVPARDLTDEEVARYRAVIAEQQRLTGLLLYEEMPAPKTPAKKEMEG